MDEYVSMRWLGDVQRLRAMRRTIDREYDVITLVLGWHFPPLAALRLILHLLEGEFYHQTPISLPLSYSAFQANLTGIRLSYINFHSY